MNSKIELKHLEKAKQPQKKRLSALSNPKK